MKETSKMLHELPIAPQGKTGWPWTEASSPLPAKMPDGSDWPKISIVTPSFNQAQYLEETIRSVLLQGYPNLEYIIIDGGSTDGSVEIIKKYEPWLTYWVSEPDRGQSHAVNKGIRLATGDLLLWLNADDICLEDAFMKVSSAFSNNPKDKMIIGQAFMIDENSKIIGEMKSSFSSWIYAATIPTNKIRQVSTFFSRDLFDDFGLINEDLFIAMDTELLLRFSKQNPPLILKDYLTAFRVHAEAKSQNNLIIGYEENDRERKKILSDYESIKAYKKNSAKHWLKLSKSSRYTPKERLRCLKNCIQNHPRVLITKEFWASLFYIAMADKNNKNC